MCYSPTLVSSGFGAFGSFGDFAPSSPLFLTTRPLDLTPLSPELVVIVKNIQKRDATTRSKAVQDLQSKIADGLDDQSIDNLLPIWAHSRSQRKLIVGYPLSSIGNGL